MYGWWRDSGGWLITLGLVHYGASSSAWCPADGATLLGLGAALGASPAANGAAVATLTEAMFCKAAHAGGISGNLEGR